MSIHTNRTKKNRNPLAPRLNTVKVRRSGNGGNGGAAEKFILTEEQAAQVEALAAYLTPEWIADYFGVSRPTFERIMADQPEIALRYKRGLARAVASTAQSLLSLVRDGNLGAICFFLKCRAGWRETDRMEISGPDGGVIPFAHFHLHLDLADFTEDELALAERMGVVQQLKAAQVAGVVHSDRG